MPGHIKIVEWEVAAPSIYQVEANDAAKYPILDRTVPTTENYLMSPALDNDYKSPS